MVKILYASLFLLGILFTPSFVHGHGTMVKPINWFDFPSWLNTSKGWVFDYVGMKSTMQCHAGLTIPREIICPKPTDCDSYPTPGKSCVWFNNYTFIEKPTLFDPNLRTYAHVKDPKRVLHTPWRAPGAAPLFSPCGAAGGNPKGCGEPDCGKYAGGFAYGPLAEKVDFKHDFYVTDWKLGDVVEVAWGITANHGGGYSYRLCKMPEEGKQGLTEECFQETPLNFVGDKSWVQYGEDESTRYEFKAVRTDKGTVPAGSQWTKSPIPACSGWAGGIFDHDGDCKNGTQFKPPGPGLKGYGFNVYQTFKKFAFSIIDKVQLPGHLEPGKYVVSFRWDCEQTPQVWTTCSNVNLFA